MGIVNVTPDSFSDGGEFLEPVQRLRPRHATARRRGRHARPGRRIDPTGGHCRSSADEELARLLPVVERLVGAGIRCLSIDTYKAAVARAALELGAAWINDVSGLADPDLAGAALGRPTRSW